MASRTPGVAVGQRRQVAVAEVGLGRRAGDDDGVAVGEQGHVALVDVDGVDDRRPRPEEAGAREQLDRAGAVLRAAVAHLARLLGGMHVARQPWSEA
jgi:hypothetical protein